MRAIGQAVTLFFFSISLCAQAESSRTYAECQQMLVAAAEDHVSRSNQVRDSYRRSIESKIKGRDALQPILEAIVELRYPHEARAAYVENVRDSLTQIPGDEETGFVCPERATTVATFDANFNAYEAVLDLIMQDVDERLTIESLDSDEGLVIIAFNTSEYIDLVRINRRGSMLGAIGFGPVRQGQYFKVIKAKAGTYTWDEIVRRFRNEKYTSFFSEYDYTFTVEPGKLNYSGVFLYEVHPGRFFSGTLTDRQTIVMTILERTYPELLEQYEIANGLFPDDRFLQFYQNEKNANRASVNHD